MDKFTSPNKFNCEHLLLNIMFVIDIYVLRVYYPYYMSLNYKEITLIVYQLYT